VGDTIIYTLAAYPAKDRLLLAPAALVKKHPITQFTTRPPTRCARCPCRQCSGPHAVSQPYDFLEIGNFAPFSEFSH